jgi:hypothetical protein
MNRAAEGVLAVEDYRAIPEGPPHYQLIERDLIISPPPNTPLGFCFGKINVERDR